MQLAWLVLNWPQSLCVVVMDCLPRCSCHPWSACCRCLRQPSDLQVKLTDLASHWQSVRPAIDLVDERGFDYLVEDRPVRVLKYVARSPGAPKRYCHSTPWPLLSGKNGSDGACFETDCSGGPVHLFHGCDTKVFQPEGGRGNLNWT